MYDVKITLSNIKENSRFLLYYETPDGVGFEMFWASNKTDFIKSFTETFENLPDDACNYDLFQYVPVQYTEVGRSVGNMAIVP